MMCSPVLIGPYVKNILVSQNHVFALAEGLLAAGSLIGVITWKAIKKKNSIEYCLTLASFIATVCYTIFNQTHSVPIAFIGCFFIGFAWGSFTLILTEVQQKTRNEYQGRVQSAIHFDATITAGLSLGEYSALVYADCLEFKDAIKLVHLRGKLMQSAVPQGTAGMLVILNMPIPDVQLMIKQLNEIGEKIDFSTDNAEGVSVLAGTNSAIDATIKYIEVNDFKRVKTQLIQMSVPSHCSLLESAQEELGKILNDVRFFTPSIPLIPNSLAKPTQDVKEIKKALINKNRIRGLIWL